MLTALITLCLAPQQDPPAAAAGAGFQEASRIYAEVADRPVAGISTLQNRLDTVQKRVEELRQQIDGAAHALVSLERSEMEQTMTIQSNFQGDDRTRRLSDLQSNAATKRLLLEENRGLLQKDLASAIDDENTLRTELGMARAMEPAKPAAEANTTHVEQRVLDYFRKRAEALGLPRIQRLPEHWLRYFHKM